MSMALLLAAAAPAWPLTVDGWGPVRIGMRRAEVEKALRVTLEGEPLDDEVELAFDWSPRGPTAAVVPVRALQEAAPDSGERAEPGDDPARIGIGAGADAVRRAYGKGLKAEAHYYEDRPSEYLTFGTVPKKRGVRFETNSKRQVQTIHAGTDAIQLVEGCA